MIKEDVILEEDIDDIEAVSYTHLKLDSIGLLQFVMDIEEIFDIEIDDENIENIGTVKDAVEYIEGVIGETK